MSERDEWFLDFGNAEENFRWGAFLMVEPTCRTMDVKYRARLRDNAGYGSGDTPEQAAISVAKQLQKAATDILTRVAAGELQQSKPRKLG